MAMAVKYACTNCHHTIEAWDEGNPYYIDGAGKKQYAYHPAPERGRCLGNDSPHLCLACGKGFVVDSRSPITGCPKCRAADIANTYELAGRRCPFCKKGMFVAKPGFLLIS
jgi:DNA-directed RNA polymerase subunit RPC12/RpoP